ncbi:MAG: hypothetical protein COB51_01400 [Moraxellaceae bacterium]|nr:MAG: hypothetical protein COB51_01400 [Moraxellaceae bacterium]
MAPVQSPLRLNQAQINRTSEDIFMTNAEATKKRRDTLRWPSDEEPGTMRGPGESIHAFDS